MSPSIKRTSDRRQRKRRERARAIARRRERDRLLEVQQLRFEFVDVERHERLNGDRVCVDDDRCEGCSRHWEDCLDRCEEHACHRDACGCAEDDA